MQALLCIPGPGPLRPQAPLPSLPLKNQPSCFLGKAYTAYLPGLAPAQNALPHLSLSKFSHLS